MNYPQSDSQRRKQTAKHQRFCRFDAVGIIPPGISNADARLSGLLSENLSNICKSAYQQIPSLQSLEILSLPGQTVPTTVLHGSTVRRHNTGLAAPTEGATPSVSNAVSKITADIATQLTPEWAGIERGTLCLDPLGTSAAPTSRVVGTSEADPSLPEGILRSGLDSIIDHHRPAVGQLLITKPDDTYRVTIRLADIASADKPLSTEQVANTIGSDMECPVANKLPDHFSTSRELAKDHWKTNILASRSQSKLSHQPGYPYSANNTDQDWTTAQVTRQLLSSTDEWTALLQGQTRSGLYTSMECEPVQRVDRSTLGSLCNLSPIYQNIQWPSKIDRDPPQFYRADVRREAAGTVHEEVLPDPEPVRGNGPVEEPLYSFAQTWLAEAGYPDSLQTAPDLCAVHGYGHPVDPDGPLLVVDRTAGHADKPATTAGEVILAANRAVETGTQLLLVTSSRTAASWAYQTLLVPWQHTGPEMTQLHALPLEIRAPRGGLVAVKSSVDYNWQLTPDGKRQLVYDDRVVASGPATDAVDTYAYDTPRLIKDGDQYAVVDKDGRCLTRQPTISDCGHEATLIGQPAMPLSPAIAAAVTVLYRDGDDCRPARASPCWNDDTSRRDVSTENALAEFIKRQTVATGNQGKPAKNVYERALLWICVQTDRPVIMLQTDRRSRTGVRIQTDNLDQPVALPNRSWRIPPDAITNNW